MSVLIKEKCLYLHNKTQKEKKKKRSRKEEVKREKVKKKNRGINSNLIFLA
jgi:hypothetical protein